MCVKLEAGGRLSLTCGRTISISPERVDDTDSETEGSAFLQNDIYVTSALLHRGPKLA
jgi:hypothetical protein